MAFGTAALAASPPRKFDADRAPSDLGHHQAAGQTAMDGTRSVSLVRPEQKR